MKNINKINGRRNDKTKASLFILVLLFILCTEIISAQSQNINILIENRSFFIGEKVEIRLDGNISEDYALEIKSQEKIYTYVGALSNIIYFYPDGAGNYTVELYLKDKGTDNVLLKSALFNVLAEGREDSIESNLDADKKTSSSDNSSSDIRGTLHGSFISVVYKEYEVGEEISVSLSLSEEQKTSFSFYYKYQNSIYKYNGELGNLRFIPPLPGTYILLLKNSEGTTVESAEIVVYDKKTEPVTWKKESEEVLSAEEIKEQSEDELSLRRKLKIKDRSGELRDYTVKKIVKTAEEYNANNANLTRSGKMQNRNQNSEENATKNKEFATNSNSAFYDVEIEFADSSVRRISLANLSFDINSSVDLNLGFGEVPVDSVKGIEQGRKKIVKAFGIDPSLLSFTTGNVSVIASGSELWKCRNWSFHEQVCNGEWIKAKDIIPGREYIIEISPEDPGYAETGLATVNTNKSIYHRNEVAEIIVVVLDSSGYLVQDASVSLEVRNPFGDATIFSTDEENIFQTERGIYRAYYIGTTAEGNYTMFVNALGSRVNNSMISQFMVSDYYEFDILRDAPVTVDPWSGPFNSSIRVVSYVNAPLFNLSEIIPLNLEVVDAGGAEQSIADGTRVLTWANLTNNSKVTYTVQPQLKSPDLIILGKAVIRYVFESAVRVFEEIRSWFIAVDPVVTRDQGLVVFADRTNDGYIKYRNWTGSLLQAEVNSGIDIIDRISWQDFRCLVDFTHCIYAGSDTGNDINFATFDTGTWTWGNYTQMDGSSLDDQRNFDVECESVSGTCIVVYEDSTDADASFSLRTWNGSTLSGATSVSVTGGENDDFRWITLFPKKNSDIMGIVLQNEGGGTGGTPAIYAGIWDGSSFGNWQTLTTNGVSQNNGRTNWRHVDCAWEGGSGDLLCVYGTNGNSQIDAYSFNGSVWSSLGNIYGGPSGEVTEIALCGQNPTSTFNHSDIGIIMCDSDNDLDGGIWNGTAFSKSAVSDSPAENTNAECGGSNKDAAHYALNFNCEWEDSGNQALFLWVDNNNDYLTYGTYLTSTKTFSNPNWDAGSQIVADGAGDIRQTDMFANPASDEIFLVYTDGSRDGGCSLWTGSSWNGAGCNNSAVFETGGPNVGVGWMTFDWFRNPPPQPEITIITPADTSSNKTYAGILNPSSTSNVRDGSFTSYPPNAANSPIGGTEISSSGYYDISTSNDVRYTTTISGAPTGRYVYQSFNFSIIESTVNMKSLFITHEGYATQGTGLAASQFYIYIYNWSSDSYVLKKTVFASTIDVTSEITIASGFNDFIRNRNMYILVEGGFPLGTGGSARADMNTDYIGITVENIPMLSRTVTVNASAVDDDGVSRCEWVFYNSSGGNPNNLTGMTNSAGAYYYNRSNISLVPDGFYNLTVFCNDTLTARTNASVYVYIDNTKPIIQLYAPGNNSNITANNALFSWNVTDIQYEIMLCNVTIDGTVRASNVVSAHGENTTRNITSITDGTHNWTVTCADDAKNAETSQTWRFDSDTTAPVITLNYPSASGYTNKNPLDLNFTATDVHTIVNCSLYLDGSLNKTLTGITSGAVNNFTFTGLTQGVHTWNVTCIDNFGFRGYSVNRNFTYDLTPPSVYLNITSGTIFNGTTPVLNYTVIDNMDSNLTCNITVNTVVELSNIPSANNTLISKTVPLLDGYKQWNVVCADDAGNVNASETRLFQVIGGPLVTIQTPSNGTVNNGSNVSFKYYTVDGNGVANCSLYINEILNQTNTTISNGANNTFVVDNINEGRYNWSVTCYDTYGYPGSSQTWQIISDRSAPAINLLSPTDGQILNATITYFNFTLVDAYSANATCNLSIDGTVSASNMNFIAQNGSINSRNQVVLNGLHYWNVTCKDSGNNFNTSLTWNFTVNATFPVGVTVVANKIEYQEGETAYINITTRNQSNGLIATNITLDYIYTNNTHTDIPWWNTSWKYRKPIVINQTNNTAINEKPIFINVTVPYGTMADCDELRVVADSDLSLINLSILSGNDVTFCYIFFVGSVSANAVNENNYHIYYGNTGAPFQGNSAYFYGNLIAETLLFDAFPGGSGGEPWPLSSAWTQTGGWDIEDGNPLTGRHAHVDGSVADSTAMPVSYFSLSKYDYVNLSFTYAIDGGWDAGEYLRYDYTNNSGSSWTQMGTLDGGGAATQSVATALSSSYKINGFNVRFRARTPDGGDDGGVDNFNITGFFIIPTSLNSGVGNQQEHIQRIFNTTNSTGMYTANFTTVGRTYGNYSSVAYAYPTTSTLRAGWGYDWFTIISDIFGPVITLIYPANSATLRSGNITFNYTATDYANDVQNCSLYINGVLNQSTPNGTLVNESMTNTFSANLSENSYTWFINCFDSLGASANSSTYSLTIDDTPPIVIALSPNDTLVASGTVTFSFNITDNFDTSISCNLSVDNGNYSRALNATNGLGSTSIQNITDGLHYWNITCYDNVNNSATSSTLNFTAASIPVVTLDSPPNGYGVNSTDIVLYYNLSSNNIDNCSLILNGQYNQTATGGQIPYTSNNGQNNFTLTSMNYGIYNWTVMCFDSNNFNGTAAARTFQLDNAAPVLNLVSPYNNETVFSRNINFTFNVSDIDNMLSCNLTIDGVINKSNQNATSGIVNGIYVAGLSITNHTWSVDCVDNTGFVTASETWNFTVDSRVNVVLSSPANNYFTNSANINLTYVPSSPADFALGFCELYLNGGVYSTHVALTSGISDRFQVTGLSQGLYSWYVNCTDSIGVVGVSEIRNFTVDMTPPAVTTYYPDATSLFNNSVFFNWSVTDDVASNMTCSVRVNGTIQSPSNIISPNNTVINRTYSGFTDGLFFWNVTCVDGAGSSGTSSLKNFTVQQAPSIALNTPSNTSRGRNQNITFYYTPSDNSGTLSSCSLILDGALNQTNSSGFASGVQRNFAVTNIPVGNHTWYVNCTDPSGNTGSSSIYNFYIDLSPPIITLVAPPDTSYIAGNNVYFNWTAADYSGTNINCSLYVDTVYNRTLTQQSGTYFTPSWFNMSDGTHTWYVICSDNLNNSVASDTWSFIINQPDLYINDSRIGFNNTNPDENARINITANVSNIGGAPVTSAIVEFWDGNPDSGGIFIGNSTGSVAFNSSRTFSVAWNITPGYHTIFVLVDQSNLIAELDETNNNATRNLSVLKSNITSPLNGSSFVSTQLSLDFNLTDYTSGLINYSIYVDNVYNNQSGQVNDGSVNNIIVNLTQGTHTIKVQAEDALGRRKNSTALTVIIDYTAPSSTINTANASWYNYSTPQISITASDNTDNMINYTIYANGAFNTAGNISTGTTLQINLSSLPDNEYVLIMEAYDDLGNIANSSPKTIYVDTTRPSIVLNAPDNDANFTTRSVLLNYTPYDNLALISACNITLDGVSVNYQSGQTGQPKTYTANNLAEGTHYWNVTCRDQANNTNTSETRFFNIFIASSITLVSPANNAWVNTANNIFYFNISDETGFENCSILLNGTITQTKTSAELTNNATNNISVMGMEGIYNWSIECYDNTSYKMYNITSNRTFYVDTQNPGALIYTANDTWFNTNPVIYFNLTDNMDSVLNYTVFINGTGNRNGTSNNGQNSSVTLTGLSNGTYEIIIQATDEALNSFNSSPITIGFDTIRPTINLLYPDNDTNITVTTTDLNFTAYDNSGRDMICNLTLDNVVVLQNVTVVNGQNINYTAYALNGGYHNWNVSCVDIARNRNTSETRRFYVLRSDIFVNESNIIFSNNEPKENETITITSLIENIGTTSAANFTVAIWEEIPGAGGRHLGNTSINLTAGESKNVSVNYITVLGTKQIWVFADRANVISEEDETNNNASKYLSVGLWHYAMGTTQDRLVMEDAAYGLLFDWELDNSSNSNIFVVDSDSDINWRQLQALGLDTSNNSQFDDFAQLDIKLNSTGFVDSINETYTLGGAAKETATFTVYSNAINNVPVCNSTDNDNFKTGIIWDYGDGGTGYNGTQDIAFLTQMKNQLLGYNSTVYDYEIRVPASLRAYAGPNFNRVDFYMEIK